MNLEEKVNNLEETIQEKDEEINEKERQVNCQKELTERETELKEKLQKELEEIKNKKQNWRNFYDWIRISAVTETKEEVFVIQESFKIKYPILARKDALAMFAVREVIYDLLNELESYLGLIIREYGNTYGIKNNFRPSNIIREYEENLEPREFFRGKLIHYAEHGNVNQALLMEEEENPYPPHSSYPKKKAYYKELKKLFQEWRNVPLQTTA